MSGRVMKYPYTISAKLAQFPLRWHFETGWVYKYWAAGVLLTIPLFMKISKLSNSPENVRKWEESKRKEAEGHH